MKHNMFLRTFMLCTCLYAIGCLTTQEKADVTAADAKVAALKAESVTDSAAIADAVAASATAHAKADDIRRERGLQMTDATVASVNAVLPFVPYGEVAAPIVSVIGLLVAQLFGKRKAA